MFRVYLKPGNASTSELANVLVSLSDLQIANGGLGLNFEPVSERNFSPQDKECVRTGYYPILVYPKSGNEVMDQLTRDVYLFKSSR